MLNSKSNVRNIGDILGKIPSSFTFQDPPLIDVPYTTITQLNGSPRQIPDPSKTLRPAIGDERIMFSSLKLVKDEKGPNGEPVQKLNNEERIRFVGDYIIGGTPSGTVIQSTAGTNFLEITFRGTGLNVLVGGLHLARDIRVKVDSDAEGVANIIPTTTSAILNARNYASNQKIVAASNLSDGIHTIRLRDVVGAAVYYHGVEIVNASTQIKIPQGEIFASGLKYTNSALQSIDYNAGFDGNPVLNGRGGRVVEYITPQGRIGKVIQQTEASAAYFGSANHSNEELIRKINPREFGANRADDFSTLTTNSSRAFTLEDGTTTLAAVTSSLTSAYSGGPEGLYPHTGVNDYFTLTFVGTGLDLFVSWAAGGGAVNTLTVDGVSQGTIPAPFTASNGSAIIKICSGLPYGTHTVKITRTSVSSTFVVADFLIYGPKKPTIPAGAAELNEYYLMANYDGSTATSTTVYEQVPQGSLFKSCSRELVYVGAGWSISLAAVNSTSAIVENASSSQPMKYTFFGTGVNLFLDGTGAPYNFLVRIDGVLNASGVARANASNGGGGTYSCTTSSSSQPCRLEFTGLSLGTHTIEIERSTGTLQAYGLYVITPVHFPNTKVGSLSMGPMVQLKASEKVTGIDLSKAKAWCAFDQVTSKILASYNIAAVLNVSTGTSQFFFEKPFKTANYSVVVGGDQFEHDLWASVPPRTNVVEVTSRSSAGAVTNDNYLTIVVFGELEDEE